MWGCLVMKPDSNWECVQHLYKSSRLKSLLWKDPTFLNCTQFRQHLDYIFMATRQPAVVADIFFFRRWILEVTWADTKLLTLPQVPQWARFTNVRHRFGSPSPKKLATQKRQIQLRYLITSISRTQQDIVHRKTALQTKITPEQAYLIRWTLVHKRWKIVTIVLTQP